MNDQADLLLERALAELLAELSDVQQDLLDVLIAKQDAVARGDIAAMQSLQTGESALGDRLEACHNERARLLAGAEAQGLPAESLSRLAAALPGEPGKLGKQVKDSAARTRLLRHHSLTNWVLAQRSLLHLSQLLEILATGGRGKPTYGKGESAHARGSLVDQRV